MKLSDLPTRRVNRLDGDARSSDRRDYFRQYDSARSGTDTRREQWREAKARERDRQRAGR